MFLAFAAASEMASKHTVAATIPVGRRWPRGAPLLAAGLLLSIAMSRGRCGRGEKQVRGDVGVYSDFSPVPNPE